MSDVVNESVKETQLSPVRMTGLSVDNSYFVDGAKSDKPEFAILVKDVPAKKEATGLDRDVRVDVLSLKAGETLTGSKMIENLVDPKTRAVFGNYQIQPRQEEMGLMVGSVLKEDDKSLQQIMDRAKKNNFLIISAHGGGNNVWQVGESYRGAVSVEKLLSGLGKLISKSPTEYGCILISACKVNGKPISQDVIDQLGVPVIYVEGFSGHNVIQEGTAKTVIAYPSEK